MSFNLFRTYGLSIINTDKCNIIKLPEVEITGAKIDNDSFRKLDESNNIFTAYLEDKVSNTRLQSVLGLQSIEIGRLLVDLVDRNMLIAEKRGRWTTYRINAEYEIQPEQMNLADISISKVDLNKTDQLIYQFVQANGMITTQQVVDMIDTISTTQGASVAINRLIEKGLLKKVRQGRHVFYAMN